MNHCESCLYFEPVNMYGLCHRYPPVLIQMGQFVRDGEWMPAEFSLPETTVDGFCGEWVAAEKARKP